MGLYNYFPSPAEGLIPLLVMNTISSVALLGNMVRFLLQIMGNSGASPNSESNQSNEGYPPAMCNDEGGIRTRRVSITSFKSLCKNNSSNRSSNFNGKGRMWWSSTECCVCLSGFEEDEEVSELSNCKHFFHKGCLEKWFHSYHHTTCPLCRSVF